MGISKNPPTIVGGFSISVTHVGTKRVSNPVISSGGVFHPACSTLTGVIYTGRYLNKTVPLEQLLCTLNP